MKPLPLLGGLCSSNDKNLLAGFCSLGGLLGVQTSNDPSRRRVPPQSPHPILWKGEHDPQTMKEGKKHKENTGALPLSAWTISQWFCCFSLWPDVFKGFLSRDLSVVHGPLCAEEQLSSPATGHRHLLSGKTPCITSIHWTWPFSDCSFPGLEIPSWIFHPPICREHTLQKHGSMFPALARPLAVPELSSFCVGLWGLSSCPTLSPSHTSQGTFTSTLLGLAWERKSVCQAMLGSIL